MVGLRQKRGEVEHCVVTDDNADAHRRAHRPSFNLTGGFSKANADLLGDRHRALAIGVAQ